MTVLVIGILLLITRLTFARIARVMVRKGRGEEESRVNRAQTLALSFRSVVQMIILVGGTLLTLQEAGLDIKTVLGGAAIIGLAVAFGAQNLMRDYFTGFMILIEDQYELGDLVTIGDATGVVEKVNMRTTVLRDLEGRVHFLPNGQIRQVTNRTYEWARAVFDIKVAYKEGVDRVMALLVELANEMRVDPDYKNDIIEEPLMLGVDGFGDAAVTIKFMLKTKPDKMFPIRRELLRRIKNRFDEEGIQIPIPHRIVFQQTET
jgi:small conductance mechanosensitive channel